MNFNLIKQSYSKQSGKLSECPICDNCDLVNLVFTQDIAFGTNQKYTYNQCPSCHHLWLELCNMSGFEKFSEPSEQFVVSIMQHPFVSSMIYEPRIKWITDRLKLSSHTTLLDIGCGTGNFLRLIRKKFGCIGEGIDIDPIFGKFSGNDGIEIKISNFEDFTSSKDYHLITMFHLIEHMNNPFFALQKAYNLLAPGGCLCIETPAVDAWAFNLFRGYWFPLLPPYHRHVFSRRSLMLLIDSLPNKDLVAVSNIYVSGEVIGSANLPLANYVPHPFQTRRIQAWKTLLALLGITIFTTLSMPLELFIAGTTKYFNIASHQRVLIRKG